MEAGKFSFKFSRQTQKNLVGSSKYAYFNVHMIRSIEFYLNNCPAAVLGFLL
jgi:hypothetical protein